MATGLGNVRDWLERRQIALYFSAVFAAGLLAWLKPDTQMLDVLINPALAFMLYVTFLQVPLAELGKALRQLRFVVILLVANFLVIPLLVFILLGLLPDDAVLRLGVLLVLSAPCIDYVVTFAHLGRADARSLLACTPLLLLLQTLLLPVYLTLALGREASLLIHAGPFVHAFVWLIAIPLVLAGASQYLALRRPGWSTLQQRLALAPVPATALVLFIVVAAVAPQLGAAWQAVGQVLPVYVLYAVLAPIGGWWLARRARLDAPASRAIAFSVATRNSLVVLPLALAVPGAMPVLPAVVVAQTLVELLAELVYVRWVGRWGADRPKQAA